MLTFNEDGHEYRWHGAVVPSVTQILDAEGISDFSKVPKDRLDAAAELGTAVHLATLYDDQGELDEASVTDLVRPRLDAWRWFRQVYRFVPKFREARLYSPHGFAGTVDGVGTLNGTSQIVLIDIKTGVKTRAVRPQTAAYAHMMKQQHQVEIAERVAVYLLGDGTCKPDPLHDPGDWSVFAAAFRIHTFKQEHR